ncbi:MAG: glycerol-3-phosphate 1-O-acyltransferase PlsY [Pseudomonadota bacterium]
MSLDIFIQQLFSQEALWAVLGGYGLGSIPFGLVFTAVAGLGDVRRIGSGNIGATNVLRTGRRGLAAATLLADGAKGAVATGLAYLFLGGGLIVALTALAALIGHVFPLWLRFRGGKGVATNLGITFVLTWPTAIIACLVWLLIFYRWRISSVAGMASALVTAPIAWGLSLSPWHPSTSAGTPLFAVLALSAVIVVLRHKDNLVRLYHGTEPTSSKPPKDKPP